MKKYLIIVFMMMFVTSGLNAGWWTEKGSGKVTKEERSIGNPKGIILKTVGNIYVKQGSSSYFRIDTDENIHEYIKTKIEDGNLIIYADKPIKPSKMNIFVTLTKCSNLTIDGSGNIELVGTLKTNYLDLLIDGSGDIEMEKIITDKMKIRLNGTGDIFIKYAKADDVFVRLAGTGDIKLIGDGKYSNVEIIGSGDINMDDFQVEDFEAKISGSGNITAHPTKSLKAKVFGSGNILYIGEPEMIKLDSFGSGTIRKK